MQYLGNKPVQGIGRSKNLFNEDILVEYGAEKLASGEYYFKNAATPYKKLLWENTENYQGQLAITFSYRYILNGFKYPGAFFNVKYTDGTIDHANTVVKDNKYSTKVMITKANKIVSNIYCSYGYAAVSTYLKNIMLNEGATALPYQPYLQRYDMYMYDNLIKLPYSNGTSKTINGITFTVDEKTGWITANGTNNGKNWSRFYIKNGTHEKLNGKYVYKGTPSGGATTTYRTILIMKKQDGTTQSINEIGNGVTFTADNWVLNELTIVIYTNATANNLVFKPELLRLIGD